MERNDDFWRIDTHLPTALGKFVSNRNPSPMRKAASGLRRLSTAMGLTADVEDRRRSLISQRFDHCFFLGDFNYRLEMEVHEIKHILSFIDKLSAPGAIVQFGLRASLAGDEAVVAASQLRISMARLQTAQSEHHDYDSDDAKGRDDEEEDASEGPDQHQIASSAEGDLAAETLEMFTARTGLGSAEEMLKHLLVVDQLNVQRAEEKVFLDFEEPSVDFKPSYKFDPYTQTYDTGAKNRGAAWCDRILYSKNEMTQHVEVLAYNCIHGAYHSDHRAVVAEFKVKL